MAFHEGALESDDAPAAEKQQYQSFDQLMPGGAGGGQNDITSEILDLDQINIEQRQMEATLNENWLRL